MELVRNPNAWSCMLASAAMVLNTTIKSLVKEIGHDGSEIIFPDLPEPLRRRGVHMQNIIDCALARGYAVTPIEALPCATPNGEDIYDIKFPEERFQNHIISSRGIFTGLTRKCYHAVAWNGSKCYDSRGLICKFENVVMDISVFWRFDKIKSTP